MDSIYEDIAARTGGNIYVGVVGPVRTGKSTLIKRIMEALVIPAIEDPYRRERARDELPQSGSGRTIMTSEPKFVPEEAVEIFPEGKTRLRVRMIDSVGYMVEGAAGAEEDGVPRMVTTPWFDHEIPMTQAAELGTRKVMEEHCSIGLVVTTDGTITDIPREDYLTAERRAVEDMRATGKPFLLILNSREPAGERATAAAVYLRETYGLEPMVLDCQSVESDAVGEMLRALLLQFPVEEIRVSLPRWLDALEPEHPVKAGLYRALLERGEAVGSLGQAEAVLADLSQTPNVAHYALEDMELSTGTVSIRLTLPEGLYYEILSGKTGMTIRTDGELLSILMELAAIRREYEKISDALSSVKATGYGVVMPTAEEMRLEKPEVLRRGGSFGVKLRAGAPSIHMLRVDVDTEISPMVGDERQSMELVNSLTESDPEKLWESHIFGKSVYELLQDGLNTKLIGMNEEVRGKFRGTLTRIVNEGASGLICLIL